MLLQVFVSDSTIIILNPKVKDILKILGITGFVAASLLMPGLPKILTPAYKKQHKRWGHFNRRILKAALKRMQTGGVIEEIEQDGEIVFKLSEKGKLKLFKYRLEDLELNQNSWDKKWRLVAYDIPKGKKNQAEAFRTLLKKMNFLQLQKSLWLTPFPCSNEIEFLKQLYFLKDHVTVLTISQLEGESAYKQYFGI